MLILARYKMKLLSASLLLFITFLVSANDEPSLLIYGDSISAGYGMKKDQQWSESLKILLKDNNIPCISSDEFLTNDEMQNIQSLCYELSEWYLFEPLNKILEYKNVNLGSVIQAEFINIIINLKQT